MYPLCRAIVSARVTRRFAALRWDAVNFSVLFGDVVFVICVEAYRSARMHSFFVYKQTVHHVCCPGRSVKISFQEYGMKNVPLPSAFKVY